MKEYEKALDLVNKAIDNNQYDLNYRNLRRKVYIKLNKKSLAEEEYQYISSNDAYYFGDYAAKAKEANDEGNYQKAIEYYNQAIEIKEYDIDLLRARAWVYLSLMKYDSALMDFKQVAEITPDYYNYFNVAYTLDLLDSIETSIEYYDKSIELKSDYHLAYNNRGYEYFRLKKYKEAIKNYTLSISIKNDYHLSYYNRGIAYNTQKKYNKAIEDYKIAMGLTENSSSIIYDIALAYDKLKNKNDAFYYFNEYLKVSGTTDSTKMNYAVERVSKLSK